MLCLMIRLIVEVPACFLYKGYSAVGLIFVVRLFFGFGFVLPINYIKRNQLVKWH